MQPRATLAIASKGRHEELPRTLAPLRALAAAGRLRILIIDQSPLPYAAAGPWRVVHAPQLAGLPAARRLAWQLTETELLIFADDDIDLPPAGLLLLIAMLQARPSLLACGPIAERRSAPVRLLHLLSQQGIFADRRRLLGESRLALLPAPFGCCFALRRQALQARDFPAERPGYALGEDRELFLRRRGSCLLLSIAGFHHRQAAVGRSRRRVRAAAKVRYYQRLARRYGRGNPATVLFFLFAALSAAGLGREPGHPAPVLAGLWRGGGD